MASVRDMPAGAAIVAAPLLVGSVHTGVVLGLTIPLLGGWALAGGRGRIGRSVPSLAFWLLAGVCLIQVLPMPGPLHGILNPTGQTLYADGWQALFGTAPEAGTWRFLSLDPGRTFDRGLRWIALGLGAGLGADHARRTGGWVGLGRAVLVAGLVVTAVGAVQTVAGTELVLFWYEPEVPLPGATTFVSDNHAATFAGLASLAGFYLAFRAPRRRPLEGSLSAVAAIGLMVMTFEFGSAGTTVGFLLALGLFVVLFVGTQTAGDLVPVAGLRTGIRGVGAALMATPALVGLLFAYGPSSWRARLWQTHLGAWVHEKAAVRVEMIRAALEATGDFWLLGAGGGATDRVLAPYLDWSVVPPATLTTIEHEPVEWLFQYGVPAGLVASALLLGYGAVLYRRFRRRRGYRYAAGLSLALYLAVVAQCHFPFFTLGIGLPAVVLLEGLAAPIPDGAFAGSANGRGADRDRGGISVGAGARSVWIAASLVAVGWFAVGWTYWDVDLDAGDRERDRQAYARLATLVPADGDLYLRAALTAREAGDRETAVRRVRHAYRREPTANIGVYAAHICRWAGRDGDARATYRRVFDGSVDEVPGGWIRYLLRDFPDPDEAADLLREASDRTWRTAARILRRERGPEAAVQFGLGLHEYRPEAFEPHRIVVHHYLKMDRAFLAETWMREMMAGEGQEESRDERYVQLLARALRAQGKMTEAKKTCERLEGWLAVRECRGE